MKTAVYKIERVYPTGPDHEAALCDIFNIPSLRSGYVEMIGEISHYASKKELKRFLSCYARFYNKLTGEFIEGSLLLKGERLFVAQ